jgi:hypothetical protein
MERNRKKKFGASLFAAGALTIAGGFLLDDPATATPAGSTQVSGSGTTSTTQATTTTPTTAATTTTQDLGVGAGGATNPGQAAPVAPTAQAALPRTGPGGIDPGLLLVLGGGLAVSGVLIVRYAADKP